MSIPNLIQSGSSSVNCGPENALAKLTKTIHKDRSLWSFSTDRRPKTTAKTSQLEDHQRFLHPQSAFDWSNAFLDAFQPQESSAQLPSLTDSEWSHQFKKSPNNAPTQHVETFATRHLIRPVLPRIDHTLLHTRTLQIPVQQQNVDWETAFLQLDQSLIQPISVSKPPTTTPTAPPAESPDALARTAASLLDTIQSRQRAEMFAEDSNEATSNETRQKFEQSSFIDLMRRLRDGQVKVEGDKMVEQILAAKDKPKVNEIQGADGKGDQMMVHQRISTVEAAKGKGKGRDGDNLIPPQDLDESLINDTFSQILAGQSIGLNEGLPSNLAGAVNQELDASLKLSGGQSNLSMGIPRELLHSSHVIKASHRPLDAFGFEGGLDTSSMVITNNPGSCEPGGLLEKSTLVAGIMEAMKSLREENPLEKSASKIGDPNSFDERLAEMNELLESEDTVREMRAVINRFQGDGGMVDTDEREILQETLEASSFLGDLTIRDSPGHDLDELFEAASRVGAPEEWQRWDHTRVPGASESWSEELDEEDFSIEGMFGRPLTVAEIEAELCTRQAAQPTAQQHEWEVLQQQQEGPAEALDSGYKFTELNPYLELHSRQHLAHEPAGSLLKSVLVQEARVRSEPESGQAWLELGVWQQANEQEDLAIAALKKALELEPELVEARLALAISYTNEDKRFEALEEMKCWLRGQLRLVKKYSEACYSKKEEDFSMMMKRIEEKPESSSLNETHEALTEVLMVLARLGGQVEGITSVDPDVQVALGVLFNTSREYEKAGDCFGAALAVRPEDPVLFNRLGATLANKGNSQEAIEYYSRALEILPSYVRARYNLSISLINLGKCFESAEHLLIGLEIQQEEWKNRTSLSDNHDHKVEDYYSSSSSGGVTSRVLWETLEINCSLIQRNDLMECCQKRDLEGLKEQLMRPNEM